LGRHFIGIERDEGYITIARERIASVEPAPGAAVILSDHQQRPRVPFGALLEAGLLQPGQKLFFTKDELVTATILANGQLQCGSLTGSIHTIAKSLFNGAPANGWESWLYEVDGQKHVIDTLRQIVQSAVA
jgi:modification methylase